MPKGHRVVTVERQGGYAARCEIERDGEVDICDITLGGFPTRTAARAALVHEEAPDTVQGVEGQDTSKGITS